LPNKMQLVSYYVVRLLDNITALQTHNVTCVFFVFAEYLPYELLLVLCMFAVNVVVRQSGSILMGKLMSSLAHEAQLLWKLLIRRRNRLLNGLTNVEINTKLHCGTGK